MFVPDPTSHRQAAAAEAGTTVLSFGGPATFEPSAWEWTFRAAAARQGGDARRVRELLDEAAVKFPASAAVSYEVACLEATAGSRDAALERLGEAVAREPRIAAAAREDEDFESLRGLPEFERIVS